MEQKAVQTAVAEPEHVANPNRLRHLPRQILATVFQQFRFLQTLIAQVIILHVLANVPVGAVIQAIANQATLVSRAVLQAGLHLAQDKLRLVHRRKHKPHLAKIVQVQLTILVKISPIAM